MKFKEYAQQNLSMYDWNKLHTLIGVSKYTLTASLNKPNKMTSRVVQRLAIVLNVCPLVLIDEWHLGVDKITVREYGIIEQLVKSKK